MDAMNERIAHAAMDETAEWSAKIVVAMRRAVMPAKRNDLQRYVLEGPYKREQRNPRLGLLILAISASTVCFGIYWILK